MGNDEMRPPTTEEPLIHGLAEALMRLEAAFVGQNCGENGELDPSIRPLLAITITALHEYDVWRGEEKRIP